MDNLDVDGELAALVREDEDANAAAASVEGTVDLLPEVGLVEDTETLLDLAGLGHAGEGTVRHVENTVLLEDRAEHGLDDNTGRGVGYERRLLVELLGEQVNTEVAVLAGSRGGGDADNLAGTALEDQDIAIADVVARNGYRVRDTSRADRSRGGRVGALTNQLNIVVVDVVVVVGEDFVGHLVQTVTKRVIMSVFVVISHSRLLGKRVGVARILYSFLGDLRALARGSNGLRGANSSASKLDLVGVGWLRVR